MSNDLSTSADQDAWAYALKVYARPGVSGACLLLQDAVGVDVLVMLHLAHVSLRQNVAISTPMVEQADALVAAWRTDVVRPLRAARRAIDKQDAATRTLRASIQQCELAAEKHALGLLAAAAMAPAMDVLADSAFSIAPVANFYAHRHASESLLARDDVLQAIRLLELQLATA